MISFGNRRLCREDAKIHRCSCGAWRYGGNPCACGDIGADVQDQNGVEFVAQLVRPHRVNDGAAATHSIARGAVS